MRQFSLISIDTLVIVNSAIRKADDGCRCGFFSYAITLQNLQRDTITENDMVKNKKKNI